MCTATVCFEAHDMKVREHSPVRKAVVVEHRPEDENVSYIMAQTRIQIFKRKWVLNSTSPNHWKYRLDDLTVTDSWKAGINNDNKPTSKMQKMPTTVTIIRLRKIVKCPMAFTCPLQHCLEVRLLLHLLVEKKTKQYNVMNVHTFFMSTWRDIFEDVHILFACACCGRGYYWQTGWECWYILRAQVWHSCLRI